MVYTAMIESLKPSFDAGVIFGGGGLSNLNQVLWMDPTLFFFFCRDDGFSFVSKD